MRRRELLALASIGPGVWPLAGIAQPAKLPTIGVLGNTPDNMEDLRRALHEVGLIEGQTVAIEWLWAAGKLDQLPELAAELARSPADLIVTVTHRVALAAKQAVTTVQIVFTRVNDPVGVGLVPSLARPGGNLTGVSLQGLDLIWKRLQLLKEAVPRLVRVAYLTDPTEPYSPAYVREVLSAARALRMAPALRVDASKPEEAEFEEVGDLALKGLSQAAAVQIALWDLSLGNHTPTSFAADGDGTFSSGDEAVFNVRFAKVPEPSSAALLLAGIVLVGAAKAFRYPRIGDL